jgi:hypothetical protein
MGSLLCLSREGLLMCRARGVLMSFANAGRLELVECLMEARP